MLLMLVLLGGVAVAVAVAVEAPRGSQRLPGVDFGAAGARVS